MKNPRLIFAIFAIAFLTNVSVALVSIAERTACEAVPNKGCFCVDGGATNSFCQCRDETKTWNGTECADKSAATPKAKAAKSYMITFDLKGGSMSEGNKRACAEGTKFTLPSPTKKSNEFLGWRYSTNNALGRAGDSVNCLIDVKMTAEWNDVGAQDRKKQASYKDDYNVLVKTIRDKFSALDRQARDKNNGDANSRIGDIISRGQDLVDECEDGMLGLLNKHKDGFSSDGRKDFENLWFDDKDKLCGNYGGAFDGVAKNINDTVDVLKKEQARTENQQQKADEKAATLAEKKKVCEDSGGTWEEKGIDGCKCPEKNSAGIPLKMEGLLLPGNKKCIVNEKAKGEAAPAQAEVKIIDMAKIETEDEKAFRKAFDEITARFFEKVRELNEKK